MIYHAAHSDDYLGYLILRGKQKQKKRNKLKHPSTKFFRIFQMIGPKNTRLEVSNESF